MEYYDIDAILAEEERVPVIFKQHSNGLGYLDSSAEDDTIRKDSKVELPLWLAQPLVTAKIVAPEIPRAFNVKSQSRLKANPAGEHLPPYFYAQGRVLVKLLGEEDIAALLTKVFALRYKELLNASQNMRNKDLSGFTGRLAVMERQLFQLGYNSFTSFEEWKNRRRVEKILPSAFSKPNSTRKRKRGDEMNANEETIWETNKRSRVDAVAPSTD